MSINTTINNIIYIKSVTKIFIYGSINGDITQLNFKISKTHLNNPNVVYLSFHEKIVSTIPPWMKTMKGFQENVRQMCRAVRTVKLQTNDSLSQKQPRHLPTQEFLWQSY